MTNQRARAHEGAIERVVRDVVAESEASSILAPQTGIAVAVVASGDVAYQGVFGLRDRAGALPVTPRTAFEVGSLTKSMTAAAFVKLAETRRVDLHAPLGGGSGGLGLPGAASAEVTLADILSHRTGLPAHDLLWYLGNYSPRELAARLEHLDLLTEGFRQIFVYNNILYGCTRLVIEDLLQSTWEGVLTDELFEPLGMRRTTPDPRTLIDDEALPYLGLAPARRTPAAAVGPAGAVRSSIEDMTAWALAQLGRRPSILSESATRTMHEARISASGLNPLLLQGFEWLGTPAYGYGWFVGEAAGQRAVFHMGCSDGFTTAVVLFPGLAHGFVAMANANLSRFPGLVAERLFARLTGREGPRAVSASPASAPAPAAPPVVAAPSGVEGGYEHPAYGTIQVARMGEQLRLGWRGNEWPLLFVGPHEAVLTIAAFGLEIPLPVAFSDDRVEIPFALDPRVAPQAFVRTRDSAAG